MPSSNRNAAIHGRISRAVEKVGAIAANARRMVEDSEQTHMSLASDALDCVVSDAHASASDAEIEAMISSLDEAVSEVSAIASDFRGVADQLREVRARVDRAMNAGRRMVTLPVQPVPWDSPVGAEASAPSAGTGG